jgi:hypothetical protein
MHSRQLLDTSEGSSLNINHEHSKFTRCDETSTDISPDSLNMVRIHCLTRHGSVLGTGRLTHCRIGWGTLIVAGGGAYYFAKKEINADRAARHEKQMRGQSRAARLENSATYGTPSPDTTKSTHQTNSKHGSHNSKGLDHAGNPSSEISEDAAPVGHAPENADQRTREKSKYEAAEPFRSKKGNRFS